MEADLLRFYQVDYLDRWRGRLTLRRIWVLLRHLPPEAHCQSILRDGDPVWDLHAALLDDIRMVLSSGGKSRPKPHPLRPKPSAPKRDPKVIAAHKRRAARARRKAAERQA